ncbi:MAG: S9 family peptidase [Anaerolineae bacterium]|nr:S9 family peptidase [Anaerolineae bacterium]
MSDSSLYTYPPAHADDIIDDYHGTLVPDPYRWLEDSESEETIAWTKAQNQFAEAFLQELPARATIYERLTNLWNYPKFSAPRKRNGRYFFRKNDGLQNQSVLYVQDTLEHDPALVLDPNTLSADGTIALLQESYSKNGRYLAYSLAESGSDWQTIHIKDLETGADLADIIHWCKFSSVAWLPDSSGFFYARYPAPGEMPDAPPSTHQKIYHHQLGTQQADDTLVYERPDAIDYGFDPAITDDGRYLIIHVWQGTDRRNRFYYRDLAGDGEIVRLLDELDAKYVLLGSDGPVFYFETDLDAENGRLIAIDITKPAQENWRELVPEQRDVIDFSAMVNNQFVVAYLHDAHSKLRLFHLDGTAAGEIELPGIGAILELAGKREHTELFINFQSFLYPPTIFRYDFTNSQLSPFRQPQVDFTMDAYETIQRFYPSKDGTNVPMFLTYKKGLQLDGNNPTILYGYGGFSVNVTPAFHPARLVWLEMGGVFAQANLRGGNEYGEAWHEAGMLGNKQNVFDDFIAAAEWLIQNNYTSNQKLAIQGRSNGGLLVSAVMIQRPELFGAVHCGVPVTDMLRYHRFTAGRYWTPEYGNAEENAAHFEFLLPYSPAHNVKPGTAYPPILITTADTDDRVVPMHSKKLAAALQTAVPSTSHHPQILRIDLKAGHGMGKPTSKLIEEESDIYAFLWTMLNNN